MLTGGLALAARKPPVNSSNSPGSSGNSRPVSTKTMSRMPGSTACPNTPSAPNQYIGSSRLGMATTVVFTVFQDTGEIPAKFKGAAPDAACGGGRAADQNLCCDTDRTRQEGSFMPIATPEVYAEMLRRAKEKAYAFPAINCTSSETINAALKGFADAGSDGILQFSTGGAEFGSGLGVKDMVTGAVALAKFAHVVAEKYPVTVALHTDPCPKDKLDTYVRPLLKISQQRVGKGKHPFFQSHMWDGSAVPIDENLDIARELLKQAAAAKIILEIEIGVVGGGEA